jgi:beta-glucanase (GH16 family)
MTSPPESDPFAPSSEAPTKGRALIPRQHIYDGPVPTVIESVSVASRRRNRSGMITAFLGLLLFGAASFWLFTPKGGDDTATAGAAASAAASPTGATGSASVPASAAAGATASAGAGSGPASGSGVPMPNGDIPGWHQTFADDFTGGDLNDRWYLYSGQPGGDPLGWWDPSHVAIRNGMLNIAGSRESTPKGNLYVTGGLSSTKSFTQKYGRYAIRFRMDKGYGLAYAMLLWPEDNSWPPEIDILEDNAKNRDMTSATLHYGTDNSMVHREIKGDFSVWHTAELDWTPGKLVYRIDGNVWTTMTSSHVPNIPMAIAIQTQAWPCGTWEGCPNSGTPPVVNFQIDWVVAYSANS